MKKIFHDLSQYSEQVNCGDRSLISAYILAKIEPGEDHTSFKDIKTLSGVNKISKTFGAYDLAIEVKFSSIQELDEFVTGKLNKTTRVKETLTVIQSTKII